MNLITKLGAGTGTLAALAFAATPAWAQDAAAAAAAAPVPNKGDTAWMMVSTILVLMMIVPGLALFYGGLVRTKNMLSVLTQVVAVAALAMLVWVFWGYTMAFGAGGNASLAGFRSEGRGVGKESVSPCRSRGPAGHYKKNRER